VIRRPVARVAAGLACALSCMPGPAEAKPVADAKSSSVSAAARTVILRPITVGAVAELSFGRLTYAGSGLDGTVILPARAPSKRIAVRVSLLPDGGETPLLRTLTGEPGRIYRVGVPVSVGTTAGALRADAFTLWSGTQGDISKTRLGAFDAQGADTLRLGATLTVPRGTRNGIYAALVPVTISYE
jgi:hypothetical protein